MLKKYIVDLLQDNPLNGISTYIDVLTLSTGVIIRKIKKYEFTGYETDLRIQEAVTLTNAIQLPNTLSDYKREPFICSHMPVTNSLSDTTTHGFYGQTLTLCFNKSMGLDTLEKMRTYLQQQYSNGTPVTVWYVLATETTEQITVPTGLSGTVDGYTTQTGTPTPTNPIYPTANTVTMWANYTPSRYNGIAFVTATGQPKQYNGDWS